MAFFSLSMANRSASFNVATFMGTSLKKGIRLRHKDRQRRKPGKESFLILMLMPVSKLFIIVNPRSPRPSSETSRAAVGA